MLTYNRLEMAKAAIECFLSQTYENKELVIVNSGSELYRKNLQTFIDYQKSDKIKHVLRNKRHGETVGDLRNCSLNNATGDYLCTWDDDDLFSRQRIESQVFFLEKYNADYCMFKNFIIRLHNGDKYAVNYEKGFEPSILYKKPKFLYPSLNKHEDSYFIAEFQKNFNEILVDNDFNDYIYCSNKDNISGEQHFLGIIKRHKSKKL